MPLHAVTIVNVARRFDQPLRLARPMLPLRVGLSIRLNAASTLAG
jgi:hypothetical protein